MERIEQQMRFILETDKIKNIYRQTYLSDGQRKENDAEHSWHLALMAPLLKEYAPDGADVFRTMLMVLLHDLVEIDAGDTYAYDEAAHATKRERECAAADRIFALLPDEQAAQYRALWEEFEAYETPEARYAHALDNCQPMLLNAATGGKAWKEHGVKRSQIEKRNEKTRTDCPKLWEYLERKIEEHVARGTIAEG